MGRFLVELESSRAVRRTRPVYTDTTAQQNNNPMVGCLHPEGPVRVPIRSPEKSSSEPPSASTPADPPKLIQYPGSPPRCGKCGAPVNVIYARKGAGGTHWCKVGHVCLYCSQPFVDKHLVMNANMGWFGPEED